MAASKPISWLYLKKTPLISLNNNFGTFNSYSGLFPFRHTTLSYYVWQFNTNHCPSESKSSLIKSSRSPNVCKEILKSKFAWDHNSVPAMMFKLTLSVYILISYHFSLARLLELYKGIYLFPPFGYLDNSQTTIN